MANVGSGRGPIGWDLGESDWHRLFEENLSGTYRLVQQVLPDMIRSGHGSIVLVASIVGLESTPAPLPYSAAKAALISYGKNLARQVGPSNVRVNSVAPGNILFPAAHGSDTWPSDVTRSCGRSRRTCPCSDSAEPRRSPT